MGTIAGQSHSVQVFLLSTQFCAYQFRMKKVPIVYKTERRSGKKTPVLRSWREYIGSFASASINVPLITQTLDVRYACVCGPHTSQASSCCGLFLLHLPVSELPWALTLTAAKVNESFPFYVMFTFRARFAI